MNSQRPFLIVSIYLSSENDETSAHNHEVVMQRVKQMQIPHIELYGRYQGAPEASILVDGFEQRRLVEALALEFSQESYIESHSDGSSFLIFADGGRQYIGQFTAVSKEEAKASGSYYYNPDIGQYFITVKPNMPSQGTSMNTTITFSVFQAEMTERGNLFNHAQAARDLDEAGISYEVVEATFKGILELGFKVSMFAITDNTILNLLTTYEQDIVLLVNHKGRGTLINPFTMKEVEL